MNAPLPETPEEVLPIAAFVAQGDLSVRRVPSFAGNRVFRVAGPTGTKFFKFGSGADIARECTAIQTAATAGVPVPRVAAVDVNGQWSPHPLIVLDQVDGRPCDGSEPVFLGGISDVLAALHSIALEGFGTGTAAGGRLRGVNHSWLAALQLRAASALTAADAGLVPSQLIERVVEAVARNSVLLHLDEGRLLHGDLHPRHVYATADEITAVIDWGDANVGDPHYDLARILHAGVLSGGIDRAVTAVTALLPGDERVLDEPQLKKMLLYAAVFVCSSMAGELEGGAPWPPWWPVQTDALTRIVTALDARERLR